MLAEALLPSQHQPLEGRRRWLHAAKRELLTVATAAFISVLSLCNAASFGLLILPASSGLDPAAGVPIFLMSTIASQVALSATSGVSFASGGATIEVVPLVAPISALAGSCGTQQEKASTLLAMLACTSLLIGCFYLAMSQLRLGSVFRCIPLIVLKSALTGVGVFIVIESAKMGVGVEEHGEGGGGGGGGGGGEDMDDDAQQPLWYQLVGPDGWPRLLATGALYVGLALVQTNVKSPLATLGYLGSAVLVVLALRAAGLLVLGHKWYFGAAPDTDGASPPVDARHGGMHGGGAEEDAASASPPSVFGLLPLFSLAAVSLPMLLSALPHMVSCAFVHALVTVTDLVSLEGVASDASSASGDGDGDGNNGAGAATFSLDREMGSIGLANLLAGCCGAMPNYLMLTPSVVALRFTGGGGGGGNRGGGGLLRVSAVAALLTAALLPAIDAVVSAVPRPVVAAFALDMGVGFVAGTGVETWRRTADPFDKLLLLLVPSLMLGLGFLPGLGAGLVLALLHFIIIYSSVPLVRWQQTGRELRSNTVRPHACLAQLDRHGHHNVTIISLQGFLMFGSVPQLGEALEALLDRRAACVARHALDDPLLHAPPWYVVVDARRCSGCDFGGVQELCKMRQVVAQSGGELRMAGAPPHVAAAIERASPGSFAPFLTFDDELRRAEDAILEAHGPPQPTLRDVVVDASTSRLVRAGFGKTQRGDHEAVVTALTRHANVQAAHVAAAARLLEIGEIREVAPGETVWRERDAVTCFAVVLAGGLTLTRHGQVIEGAKPGTMAGFLNAFEAGQGAVHDLSFTCGPAVARLLVVRCELLAGVIGKKHLELERLLMRAFLARAATQYSHWLRHDCAACIAKDDGQ